MCTLSFVPTDQGYLVGMNRDEQLGRARALPPAARIGADGLATIYPREPGGGTWIACNQNGLTLALLNWHEAAVKRPRTGARTRGAVIPALIGQSRLASVAGSLARMPLDGMQPFRLVGIFPKAGAVREWRWDGSRVGCGALAWERLHWFSSSLSDAAAARIRGAACRPGPPGTGGQLPGWMWRLHRSHEPLRGPFSVCVHRSDAATVSYTEVDCSTDNLCMRYVDGGPCLKQGFDAVVQIGRPACPEPAGARTALQVHC